MFELIVMEHWTRGGTGITNVSSDFEVYEQAIKEYGDPKLVLYPHPFGGGVNMPEWKSLHDLRGRRDLSAFWRLWELIKWDRNFEKLQVNGEATRS